MQAVTVCNKLYSSTGHLYYCNIVYIMQLLDMCRCLDAMEANGFTDRLEEAEVATLRVLMSVSLTIRSYCKHNNIIICLYSDCLAENARKEQTIKLYINLYVIVTLKCLKPSHTVHKVFLFT